MLQETEYIEQIRTFHGCIPYIMNTRLEVIACGVENADVCKVWEQFCTDIEAMDALLNRYKKESEVAGINASVPLDMSPVSAVLGEVLQLCSRYHTLTNGLFDITRGYADHYVFSEDHLVSLSEGDLDFGGFAKGYAMLRFKQCLENAGVENAFVNFGNSTIMGMGKHPCGNAWHVDVMDPFTKDKVVMERLRDTTLSTSGNTPWNKSHIINPRTGEKVTGRRLACVVSPNPLDAEVLSTVAMIADESDMDRIRANFPDAKIELFGNLATT